VEALKLPGRVLSEKAVCEEKLAGAAHGTLRKLMKDPVDPFPGAIPLSGRRMGWLETEIDAWLERRRQRRDNEEQRRRDIAARRPNAGPTWR
jgi:predicted DNA-binding transcriptional regulator AlpA